MRLPCEVAAGTTAVQELLLHPLVASETTGAVVAEAAQHLDTRQALALLRYLAAWLAHHGQLLAGWLHPVGRQRRGRGAAPRPQRGAATDGRGRDCGPLSGSDGCSSRYPRPYRAAFKVSACVLPTGETLPCCFHPNALTTPGGGRGQPRMLAAICGTVIFWSSQKRDSLASKIWCFI